MEDGSPAQTETELRARTAMMIAFALIVSPIVMLFIFLLVRAVNTGDGLGMLMIAAMVWFAIAEYFIGGKVDKLVSRARFGWMTPRRGKALSDALVLGPVMAFCLVDQNGTGREMLFDYWIGFLAIFIFFMLQSELVAYLKPHAMRLWANTRKS